MQSDLKTRSPSFEHVERHVAALFTANPRADPMSMRKPNFLNTAKATLPTKGQTFTHLHLPHGDERDPVRMAAALKEHWGPLWTRDNPTPDVISDYLSSYTKRLDPIPSVSLESVLTVLAERRDSSIGPDGIPFSVYRLLADIVAPLFLRVFRHASLAASCRRLVNRSFNFVNMFFFPKDNSNTPPNLRPIAVSNTDNRLIASILHTLISPAILKLLDPAQLARPGAPIDENVAFFKERFYAAVESKQDYHLLLHDFEKAFDRTSRHHLLALLRHIGAPSWVINLLVTLFENVVALPILAGPHSTRIQMTNGLKQGCPLSPLLFCLALDPLISAIAKCHIDVRAYVDDIACGSPAIAPLALALPHFDRFNAASGSATSL